MVGLGARRRSGLSGRCQGGGRRTGRLWRDAVNVAIWVMAFTTGRGILYIVHCTFRHLTTHDGGLIATNPFFAASCCR